MSKTPIPFYCSLCLLIFLIAGGTLSHSSHLHRQRPQRLHPSADYIGLHFVAHDSLGSLAVDMVCKIIVWMSVDVKVERDVSEEVFTSSVVVMCESCVYFAITSLFPQVSNGDYTKRKA